MRFSDSVAGIFASFTNQFKQRRSVNFIKILTSLSKRSRSCLFVGYFSLISRHLVPVVIALIHLLKHTLKKPVAILRKRHYDVILITKKAILAKFKNSQQHFSRATARAHKRHNHTKTTMAGMAPQMGPVMVLSK